MDPLKQSLTFQVSLLEETIRRSFSGGGGTSSGSGGSGGSGGGGRDEDG